MQSGQYILTGLTCIIFSGSYHFNQLQETAGRWVNNTPLFSVTKAWRQRIDRLSNGPCLLVNKNQLISVALRSTWQAQLNSHCLISSGKTGKIQLSFATFEILIGFIRWWVSIHSLNINGTCNCSKLRMETFVWFVILA